MVDQKEQQSETHSEGSPQRSTQDNQEKRGDKEQRSSQEVHPLHPSAPTRAQQQRHRRNLRLNGQVDIEEGSTSRYAINKERRDSWIDRINHSTKNAIRRTSTLTNIDEKKLIDKVADSINQYGEEHEHDSWTDKLMDFIFPSMADDSNSDNSHTEDVQVAKEMTPFNYLPSPFNGQRTPVMSPSDTSYDKAQQTENQACLKSWAIETTDNMDIVDQRALNQHPHLGMTPQTSDQAYDQAQTKYPDDQSVQCYADALEEQEQHEDGKTSKPIESSALQNDLENRKNQQIKKDDALWPPVQSVDQDAADNDTISIEKAKKDRRRQRQQERKHQMDDFAA